MKALVWFGFLVCLALAAVFIVLGYQLFTDDKAFGGFCFCVLAALSGSGSFCTLVGIIASQD